MLVGNAERPITTGDESRLSAKENAFAINCNSSPIAATLIQCPICQVRRSQRNMSVILLLLCSNSFGVASSSVSESVADSYSDSIKSELAAESISTMVCRYYWFWRVYIRTHT